MDRGFSSTLASLRKSRGLSQRAAAGDLKISQALLSHYENGAREPGLAFLVRASDYYGVSTDYLLGRTDTESPGDSPWSGNADAAMQSVAAALRSCDNPELNRAVERYITASMLSVLERITQDKEIGCRDALKAELAMSEVVIDALISKQNIAESPLPPAGIECQRLMAGLKALVTETSRLEY